MPGVFDNLRRSISKDTVMSKKNVTFLNGDDLNRSQSHQAKEYMTTFGD